MAAWSERAPSGMARTHDSAELHTLGTAPYIDDLPLAEHTAHAAPVMSPVGHGVLRHIDWDWARAQDGVLAVITPADIPGDPVLANHAHDEPIFASEELMHHGQVMGLVVARDALTARRVARAIPLDIQALPPILNARDALARSAFVLPSVHLQRGDLEAAWAQSATVLTGSLEVGGQEHFYLEGQVAYVLPQEDGQWLVHSSTQHPGEVQHVVAHALGLPLHAVQVVCRRMGGGFGGKETQAGHVAIWAALAANQTQRPIKLRLDRTEDMLITGKRHPFSHDWQVGFDAQGRIQGLHSVQLVHCGHSADLSGPVADRAIFHTDNAYHLPAVDITSHRCLTHTQSHTAFRGFGGPQGVILIETILGDIARHLRLDPFDVRLANLYGEPGRDVTPYGMTVDDAIAGPLMQQLARDCDYRARRQALAQWNADQPLIKRGLALTPVKFGISFTATQFNQAGALVHVYTDGSVRVSHGGTEMGQGLHTKVCGVVAGVLGLSPERVRISATDTHHVPNASATAASSGTDLNGRAAERAAMAVRKHLAQHLATLVGCQPEEVVFREGQVISPQRSLSFVELVQSAYAARVPLWSHGFYATPDIHYDRHTLTGRPFYYFAYGAACSEVAIDTLTGEHKLLRVDILHDVGQSLHPEIDRGQIEGGFAQGLGWLTSEELVWNDQGLLQTRGASTYKIPTAADLPPHFKVALWPEANRKDNVGGSKAVGEPPFMLAISVFEALRDAIGSVCPQGPRVALDAPATPERVLRAIQHLRAEAARTAV